MDGNKKQFDFDAALGRAVTAVETGPHCSCAEIAAEVLRAAVPLHWTEVRYAAAGFGGGVVGNGSVCGAFSAGLIVLGLALAEREEPQGCITEQIMGDVHAFYDEWTEKHGSIYCADLTGFPSLRDETARDEFWASTGPQKCTDVYIRFAVEKVLELIAARGAK
jgi:C_GCAxxG_C_C family probable redox protein